MRAGNKCLSALVIGLFPMVGFAMGNTEQDYIESIVSKYRLSLEISSEKSFSYAPVGDRCFYYGEEGNLRYRCGGQEQTIQFPPDLDPGHISGVAPQYYIPETGKLYTWIVYKSGDSMVRRYYIYDTQTITWQSVPYVDEKIIFNHAVVSPGVIVFTDLNEKALIAFDPSQETTERYRYGTSKSYFPFDINDNVFGIGATLIVFQKDGNLPNGRESLVLFDFETEQYDEYVLPHGGFRDFVLLREKTFYCIEDYEFLPSARRKSRIVKLTLDSNAFEIVALDKFNRELFDFKRMEGNLYSFIVDTGKATLGAGRVGGHRVLFTVRLPE